MSAADKLAQVLTEHGLAGINAHLRRRGWAGENVVVRRRVTDWEPVEGEHS